MSKTTLALSTVVFFSVPFLASAFPSRAPEIQIIDIDSREVQQTIPVLSSSVQAGLHPLVTDLDADKSAEIVVVESTGKDSLPIARIYTRNGILRKTYPLFLPEHSGQELSISVGNIDADPEQEIALAFPDGASTRVYLFDHLFRFHTIQGGFEAFPGVASGAVVTLANVIGDSMDEIIVGTSTGVRGQVQVFDQSYKPIGTSIIPFAEKDTQGLTLGSVYSSASATHADIMIGMQAGAQTWMKIYRFDAEFTYPVLAEERIFSREFLSGLSLQSADITHDGVDEILVAPQSDQQAEIALLNTAGKRLPDAASLYVFEEDFRGGVVYSVGQLDSDISLELVVAPRIQEQKGDLSKGARYIEVDLSSQTTTLWEDGYIRNVYLIASGLPSTPTPVGETKITRKIASHVYDGRPEYYYPNTPWNLLYRTGGYFFHTAYWHNAFGAPRSHGCINMKEPDARFLYFWADIGTTVIIHY